MEESDIDESRNNKFVGIEIIIQIIYPEIYELKRMLLKERKKVISMNRVIINSFEIIIDLLLTIITCESGLYATSA